MNNVCEYMIDFVEFYFFKGFEYFKGFSGVIIWVGILDLEESIFLIYCY